MKGVTAGANRHQVVLVRERLNVDGVVNVTVSMIGK